MHNKIATEQLSDSHNGGYSTNALCEHWHTFLPDGIDPESMFECESNVSIATRFPSHEDKVPVKALSEIRKRHKESNWPNSIMTIVWNENRADENKSQKRIHRAGTRKVKIAASYLMGFPL